MIWMLVWDLKWNESVVSVPDMVCKEKKKNLALWNSALPCLCFRKPHAWCWVWKLTHIWPFEISFSSPQTVGSIWGLMGNQNGVWPNLEKEDQTQHHWYTCLSRSLHMVLEAVDLLGHHQSKCFAVSEWGREWSEMAGNRITKAVPANTLLSR